MEQQHTTVALEEPVGQGLLDGAASLFGGWGYVNMMMDGGADSV